jgi:hypothetical protein
MIKQMAVTLLRSAFVKDFGRTQFDGDILDPVCRELRRTGADGKDYQVKNVGKFYLTRFLGYAIIKLLKPPALILSNQNTAGF